MTGYVKTSEIAEATRMSRKQVLARSRAEGWPCVRRKGGLAFLENRLPKAIQEAITRKVLPQATCDDTGSLLQLTDKAREVARNRSALIYEYYKSGIKAVDFIEAYNAGQVVKPLFAKLGKVSMRTLYRWVQEHKEAGALGTQALAALAPRHGIKKSGAGFSLSDYERCLLRQFWLVNTRPTIASALIKLKQQHPASKCTYQIAQHFLNSIPPAVRDFYRLGKKSYDDLYMPYVEQNINHYQSLDRVISDHCVMDCVVMYQGRLVRPWLTTFQDYRSGKILSAFPTVKPSSLSIIAAYYMCCIRYGVPKEALFDNGKDYRSKLLNGYKVKAKVFLPEGIEEEAEIFFHGILPALGTDVHFTRPYSGKSKGRQERYYRLLGEYLAKDIGSYIGSDTTTRPEDAVLMWRSVNGLAKREDIPTWEYFAKAAASMIEYINDTFESQGKGMNGKTRSIVFAENLPQTIRRVSAQELQQALYRSEVRKCGRNGIKHHGINYYHPALMQYAGQDVIIRNKIVTDSEMPVYATNGTFICNAIGNYFAEGQDLQAAIKRVEHVKKHHSLLALAERGTNEIGIEADQRIMLETAIRAYDDSLPSLDSIFGEPEALPLAAGAEGQFVERPKKQTKYISELDASAEQILRIGGEG